MSNPILTEQEAQQAAAQEAQTIADQQPGAVLLPQQQGSNPQDNTPTQNFTATAPQQQRKSASEEIDSTIRGLLIQIIALQHNKDAQQSQ
jgi:hypothetical protein